MNNMGKRAQLIRDTRNHNAERNGRRSRGASPNIQANNNGGANYNHHNHHHHHPHHNNNNNNNANSNNNNHNVVGGGTTTDTSDTDDNSNNKRNGRVKPKANEYEEKIRVGRDFQAVCPPWMPDEARRTEHLADHALLVWSPTSSISDKQLQDYISLAREKFGYNGEQALGMLFWHRHDLERAAIDLSNFTPFPDEWTAEDKVLFEQAFQFHGKNFQRIRQMLPDKSIASLVKYYYSWKKIRNRNSANERPERAHAKPTTSAAAAKEVASEAGSDPCSPNDSDGGDDKLPNDASSSSGSAISKAKLFQVNTKTYFNYDAANKRIPDNISGRVFNKRKTTLPSRSRNGGGLQTTNGSSLAIAATSTSTQTATMNFNEGEGEADGVGAVGNKQSNGLSPSSSGGNDNFSELSSNAHGSCTNCDVYCHKLCSSPIGDMCASCFNFWSRTGNKRPTSGPFIGKRSRYRNADRAKRTPPNGIYINHDDLLLLSTSDKGNEFLSQGERKIKELMAGLQVKKQAVEDLEKELSVLQKSNSEMTLSEQPPMKISQRWTNLESEVLVYSLRDFGKNFARIAEILGTKTEAHVRTYYLNNRRRLNLDQVLKEHAAKIAATTTATVATATATSTPSLSSATTASSSADTSNKLNASATKTFSTTAAAASSSVVDVAGQKTSIDLEIDVDSSNEQTGGDENRNNSASESSATGGTSNDSGDSEILVSKSNLSADNASSKQADNAKTEIAALDVINKILDDDDDIEEGNAGNDNRITAVTKKQDDKIRIVSQLSNSSNTLLETVPKLTGKRAKSADGDDAKRKAGPRELEEKKNL